MDFADHFKINDTSHKDDETAYVNLPITIAVDGKKVIPLDPGRTVSLGNSGGLPVLNGALYNPSHYLLIQIDEEAAIDLGYTDDLMVIGMWVGYMGAVCPNDVIIHLIPHIIDEDNPDAVLREIGSQE
jgi:hypothetical protein